MEFGIQWRFAFVSDKSQVAFSAFSDGPVHPFALWLRSFVQLNYQDQNTSLDGVCQLGVKIFKQAWYVEPSSVISLLVGVSASSLQTAISAVTFPDFITLELPNEDNHGYFLCSDPRGSTLFLFLALDRRVTWDKIGRAHV